MTTNPPNTTARPSKFVSWCRLLRVPNLFTVPGDPIVGFFIARAVASSADDAAWVRLWWPPVVSALLLYAAGLLANDYFDLAEDRRDRPGRPLPAGDVRAGAAIVVAIVAVLAGVGLAAWVNPACGAIALALGACAMLYDWRLKRVPVIGPLTMGACRGLSLLLGAAAWGPEALTHMLVLLPAACLSLYIAAITLIAVGEARQRSLRGIRWGPPAAMLALLVAVSLPTGGFLLFMPAYGFENLWVVTCTLMILAAGASFAAAERLRGDPPVAIVQRTVGQLIRNLLLVHAAVAGGMGHWLIAVALLAAWPASAMLARRFYAS